MANSYRSMVPRFRPLHGLLYSGSLIPTALLLVLVASLLFGNTLLHAAEVADPLEPLNRASLKFNRGVDTLVLKPVAKTWQQVAPAPVKKGVRNFFSNLGELRNIVNGVLQLRIGEATSSMGRFAVNTTLGIGGLIDVADPVFGLQQQRQDFGRTLAHWGVGSGPYLVLPFFGPSTVRDALGTGFDTALSPVAQAGQTSLRDPLLVTQTVDTRARYLPFDELIFGDEYLFIRDAYLQSRQYEVEGGNRDVAFEEF